MVSKFSPLTRGATLAFAVILTSVVDGIEVHVNPNLIKTPEKYVSYEPSFASVIEARNHLRWLKASDPVERDTQHVVYLHPGTHVLDASLNLDHRDSNTRWIGVAHESTSTRMTGGKAVPFSAWAPTKVPSGATGAMKASLGPLGFNSSVLGSMSVNGGSGVARLYVDGKPMMLSRSPNVAEDGTWMWYGYENFVKPTVDGLSFTLTDSMATEALKEGLNDPEGLWLHGYWKFDWRDNFVKINSITSDGNGSVFTRDSSTDPAYNFTAGCRFYGVNSLAFLDTPGEYYIDRVNGLIYFIPPAPLTTSSDIMLSFLDSVVESSASNTSFESMVVSIAKGDVIAVSGDNTTVSDSTVSNAGGSCLKASGSQVTISGNTVFGCGADGININSGSIATLESGNSSVVRNDITDFSRVIRTYQPGIGFSGVGLYIAWNNVSHGPHTAMTGGGNNHLFEHNIISNVCFECTDTGAFYVGRSWSQRGNVVRYNTFDTIRPIERLAQKSCSQNAFYLDDEMSGYLFTGNTIINSTTGVLLGGGRRNSIVNNTFINNDVDIAFDDRGMSWQLGYCRQNCTDNTGAVQPACFYKELEGLHYQSPPYSTAYPEIVNIFSEHPCLPVYNNIASNKYCHTKSKSGGKFITQTNETVYSWMSTMTDNVEQC